MQATFPSIRGRSGIGYADKQEETHRLLLLWVSLLLFVVLIRLGSSLRGLLGSYRR